MRTLGSPSSKRGLRVCRLILAAFSSTPVLVAGAQPEIAPDAESLGLVTLSEQARQIAQREAPYVVLRQLDTDLSKTFFRFTDRAATKAIDETVPSPNAPPEQWTSYVPSLSLLLGRSEPDMRIGDLRAEPNRVVQAMTSQWQGCAISALTLYRNESDNDLVWIAFCDTAQGTVSGKMVNRTGVFRPFNAPRHSDRLQRHPHHESHREMSSTPRFVNNLIRTVLAAVFAFRFLLAVGTRLNRQCKIIQGIWMAFGSLPEMGLVEVRIHSVNAELVTHGEAYRRLHQGSYSYDPPREGNSEPERKCEAGLVSRLCCFQMLLWTCHGKLA